MSKSKGPQKTSAPYRVGRGKPPKEHQFQPGRSGNPGGRKKGTRNLGAIFSELGQTEIEVIENGRRRRVEINEALCLSLVKVGLDGNTRAISTFFHLHSKLVPDRQCPREAPSEQDERILRQAFRSAGAVERLSPLSNDTSKGSVNDSGDSDEKEEGGGDE